MPPAERTTGASTDRSDASRIRTIAQRGERLVVVVAHPDDETFGCGSLIAAATLAGATVTVVCATAGELGESTMAVARHELGRIRERELHSAAAVLGAARVVLLGYTDSGVDGPAAPGSLCAAPLDAVTDRIGEELDRLDPDVVLVLDGSDGHRDHLVVRDAVVAALDRRPASTVRMFEHVLLRSLMHEWVAARRVAAGAGDAYVDLPDRDLPGLGRPDDEVTHVVATEHVLARRERAISMHVSQTSPFDGLDPALARRFLTADHLVRIR